MNKTKFRLKTIRLTKAEEKQVAAFLKERPHLGNFSTVLRAALREFMMENAPEKGAGRQPSFLWEYALSEGEIQEILRGPQQKRLWLVAKILEHARWHEIWHYLSVDQIARDLPYLRLPEKTAAHWRYAINRWRIV